MPESKTIPVKAAEFRSAEVLASLGQLALESVDWGDLLKKSVYRIGHALAVDSVQILELDRQSAQFNRLAVFGLPDAMLGQTGIDASPRSQPGFTLLANEPVVVEDLSLERRFSGVPLNGYSPVSSVSITIGRHPHPYGVLIAQSKQRRIFGDDEVRFLRAAANLLAAVARGYQSDQESRDSSARVHAIVNTLVDGIITIDERGIIESLNPAAQNIFGYSAAELKGRNVNVLMPDPYQSEHDGYLANYIRTGHQRIIGIGREVSGRRKDGSTFPMDLAVSQLQVSGRRMFTGVVRDVTERRRMEREILEAGATEQRRIGQDLHDGLCQHLAGIAFAVEVLSQKLAARDAPEAAGIRKIAEMIDQSMTQARDLARGLQPVTLDANGLVAALSALVEQIESMFHISCILVCDGPCPLADNNVATHLYRIAQESISNAIKHGNARTVVVDLSVKGGDLQLSVKDDGIGITKGKSDGAGMGLRSMDYRARLIGGTLRVLPVDKGGTAVVCTIPNVVQSKRKLEGPAHGKKVTARRSKKEDDSAGRRSPHRS
jgi:PAS domain S-box-containing protein